MTSAHIIGDLTNQAAKVNTAGALVVGSDISKGVYRAVKATLVPVATPTDICQIKTGAISTNLRIRRIRVFGTATGAGNMTCQLIRRSTIGTIGSAVLTALTAAQMDVNDAAPVGVVSTVGTANWTTLGTSAGVIAVSQLEFAAVGTGVGRATVFDFTNDSKGCIIRGSSTDYLWINLNGEALPAGGKVDIEVDWQEFA